ncbi:cache domain-containing protein [Pseudomonas sp. BMS12]|uniref:cache domain-containing protein n=1 Tax=Pseudomonas sp. BMS12 TaxID=1796033 RepID=UPI00083ACB98|nr:cache domain-containing protein [Pseudomonas sp. BMS12]
MAFRAARTLGVLLLSASLTFILGQQLSALRRDELLQRLDVQAGLRQALLQESVDQLHRHVQFLARVPPIQGIAAAQNIDSSAAKRSISQQQWKRQLQSIFASYMAVHPDIIQLRYIGMKDGGKEVVRVDRVDDIVVALAPHLLQSKAARDYFKATARLGPGQIYTSDLNLNREFGKIEVPHIATLRASIPVFGPSDARDGMLVVNINAGNMLAQLNKNVPAGLRLYLCNERGDFLLHPEPGKSFGFDLGERHLWKEEFTAAPGPGPFAEGQEAVDSPSGRVYVVTRQVQLDNKDGRILILRITAPFELAALPLESLVLLILLGAALATALLLLVGRSPKASARVDPSHGDTGTA